MPSNTLDRAQKTPLWQQLQRDLRVRLAAGEFADRFPGELALVQEYAVSRHTVRQALRQLRADGLVVAERGRQPRVAAPAEIRQPMGALYSLFASVEQAGLSQHSRVRTLDVRTDAVVAKRLRLGPTTRLVYLERIRLAGEEPLALDRVWLPEAVAAPLLTADFSHTSLYNELDVRAGIRLDRGDEQISAVVPTTAERALLHCGSATAAFSVNRLGYSEEVPLEWRHTLIRGDRFALTGRFSAEGGYRLTSQG
jgi:GntR family transcriptional regulator